MRIDFVTLGGVSERLNVPPPTLRNWTDQLEEFEVHYIKRNDRNERIYYEQDLEIFRYIRDMKHEHGRKTTTERLAKMLLEDGRFELRSKENAPSPIKEPNNKTELLNQEDIKELMNSERVQQFMRVIVDQTTKNIKEDLIDELSENINREMGERIREIEQVLKNELKNIHEGQDEILSRIETYGKNNRKGFWGRLFSR